MLKLYMILLGCKPKGRNTEQHDIFFGIGTSLKELVPAMQQFWPEAQGKLHIDAWREVNIVDNHKISVIPKNAASAANDKQLFFLNLGGYKANEFEEFHYKLLVVASTLDEARGKAKQTAFFKHTSLKHSDIHREATSHIDDKYGIDVDDMYNVEEILPTAFKDKYSLQITPGTAADDASCLGYLKIADLVS